MTQRYVWLICLIMNWLLLSGCVDTISIRVPDEDIRKLVIQGSIVKGNPAEIDIHLGYSTDFARNSEMEPISGAVVQIADEAGQLLTIPEQQAGIYRLSWANSAAFRIERGGAYQLQVRMNDGEQFQSTFEKIHAVPEPEAVEVKAEIRTVLTEDERIVDKKFVRFLVDTPLQHPEESEKSYLKWDFEGVYKLLELEKPGGGFSNPKTCFLKEKLRLGNLSLFNGFETSASRISGYVVFEEEINWNYAVGYYLTVYQQSLSKGAFEYWSKVNEVTAREGGLSEPPPGKIPGNIRNVNDPAQEILGYFYGMEVDTIRRLIRPEEVFMPLQYCPQFEYEESPGYCRNCLLWPNSSLEKPAYWEE